MAPAFLLVFGVLAYPIGWEAWISLTNFSTTTGPGHRFVGLGNFAPLATDPFFWHAAATTVAYVLLVSVVDVALGLAMALPLVRPARGRTLAFVAVFLPWAFPAAVTVIAWYWIMNPPLLTSYSGAMAHLKLVVDGTFGSGAWAFLSVVLFNVWRGASFTAVFLLAGINAIPTELFEYAQLEATSGWQRLRHVIVPLLWPFIALAVFFSLTSAFADLANVWMLTGGRIVFPLLGTTAYRLGIHSGRVAEAAAWSLSLVPFLAAALLVLFGWFDRDEAPA